MNIHQAKTQLARLVAQVDAGEEVVIARNRKPVALLVRYRHRGVRRFGALKGKIEVEDTFFDPLPGTELAAWGK